MILKTYQFSFPLEIIDAINGLDHEIRLKIVEYLANNEKILFSKIRSELNLREEEYSSISKHMEILSEYALIDKYTTSLDNKSDEKSFYKLSPFAIKIINGMLSSLEVRDSTFKLLKINEITNLIDAIKNPMPSRKKMRIIKKKSNDEFIVDSSFNNTYLRKESNEIKENSIIQMSNH